MKKVMGFCADTRYAPKTPMIMIMTTIADRIFIIGFSSLWITLVGAYSLSERLAVSKHRRCTADCPVTWRPLFGITLEHEVRLGCSLTLAFEDRTFSNAVYSSKHARPLVMITTLQSPSFRTR
jgi:hypothetical protein